MKGARPNPFHLRFYFWLASLASLPWASVFSSVKWGWSRQLPWMVVVGAKLRTFLEHCTYHLIGTYSSVIIWVRKGAWRHLVPPPCCQLPQRAHFRQQGPLAPGCCKNWDLMCVTASRTGSYPQIQDPLPPTLSFPSYPGPSWIHVWEFSLWYDRFRSCVLWSLISLPGGKTPWLYSGWAKTCMPAPVPSQRCACLLLLVLGLNLQARFGF